MKGPHMPHRKTFYWPTTVWTTSAVDWATWNDWQPSLWLIDNSWPSQIYCRWVSNTERDRIKQRPLHCEGKSLLQLLWRSGQWQGSHLMYTCFHVAATCMCTGVYTSQILNMPLWSACLDVLYLCIVWMLTDGQKLSKG